jgi:hypothetical protein
VSTGDMVSVKCFSELENYIRSNLLDIINIFTIFSTNVPYSEPSILYTSAYICGCHMLALDHMHVLPRSKLLSKPY